MHDELPGGTHGSDAGLVARLTARIEAQQAVIRSQAAELAHNRRTFERASAEARIGMWECRLSDEAVSWTDVVYELFDMPRGAPIRREATVECYTPESVAELAHKRSRAIAEQSGFGMEAEIVTPKGNRRWIRITASIESEHGAPVRLLGMKQDITEARLLLDRTRYLAEFDVMTGLANRAQFQARLAAANGGAGGQGLGALMLIDLDGFKTINDTFGHAVGDLCLQEAGRRLSVVCARAALVARIGGDEFAVLFDDSADLGTACETARAVLAAFRDPFHLAGHTLTFGASLGIAPAAAAAADLFVRADSALYAAKHAGRNTFRIFKASRRTTRGGKAA